MQQKKTRDRIEIFLSSFVVAATVNSTFFFPIYLVMCITLLCTPSISPRILLCFSTSSIPLLSICFFSFLLLAL